jgi:hypothetical protein
MMASARYEVGAAAYQLEMVCGAVSDAYRAGTLVAFQMVEFHLGNVLNISTQDAYANLELQYAVEPARTFPPWIVYILACQHDVYHRLGLGRIT